MKLDVNEVQPGDVVLVTGYAGPSDVNAFAAMTQMLNEQLASLGAKCVFFGDGEFDISILRQAPNPAALLDITRLGDREPRYMTNESPDLADDALARP